MTTKLLILDLDNTVRRPKSGAKFISDPLDQEIIPEAGSAIAHYKSQGWLIVRERLTNYAESYAKFLELEEKEREWLFPLLSRGTKTTVQILQLIAEQPMTFEELADEVGCCPTTVTQKLNALSKGGFGIEMTDTTASAPTGRPRKLVRR